MEFGNVPGEALVMQGPSKLSGTAELYDSGSANHLSRHLFQNFKDIAQRKFRAEMFSTTGKGKLVVDVLVEDVPNGNNHYCKYVSKTLSTL